MATTRFSNSIEYSLLMASVLVPLEVGVLYALKLREQEELEVKLTQCE